MSNFLSSKSLEVQSKVYLSFSKHVDILYNPEGFEIFVDNIFVSTEPFRAHIFCDFFVIQSRVSMFLKNHLEYIHLSKKEDNDSNDDGDEEYLISGSTSLKISNNDELLLTHLEKWCNFWNINKENVVRLLKRSVGFSNRFFHHFYKNDEKYLIPVKYTTQKDNNSDKDTTVANSIYYTNPYTLYGTNPYGNICTTNVKTEPFSTYTKGIDFDNYYSNLYLKYLYLDTNWTLENHSIDFNLHELDSPLLLLFTIIKDYRIIDNLLNIPAVKFDWFFKGFVATLIEYYHYQKNPDSDNLLSTESILNSYQQYGSESISISQLSKIEITDDIKLELKEHLFHIMKKMPKIISKYPLTPEYPYYPVCYIPNISVIPKTELQWKMTQIASKYIFGTKVIPNCIFNEKIDELNLTKTLLPYITISDSIIDVYCNYKHIKKENWKNISIRDGEENDQMSSTPGEEYIDLFNEIKSIIEDGKKIYENYKNYCVEIPESGIKKMAPIEGSILKRLQNSIYNHHLEEKISLEEMMKILQTSTNESENMMFIPKELILTTELEKYRIKTKTEMIACGKAFKHCLGNYVEDKSDLFFRKDVVCAKVSISDLQIIMCLDYHNTKTPNSNIFKEELTNLLREQKLKTCFDIYSFTLEPSEGSDISDFIKQIEKQENCVFNNLKNSDKDIILTKMYTKDIKEYLTLNNSQWQTEGRLVLDANINNQVILQP